MLPQEMSMTGNGILETIPLQNKKDHILSDTIRFKTYDVILIVSSIDGCTDTVSKSVNIFPLPSVNFKADTMQGCERPPLNVKFDGSASKCKQKGAIESWLWNFGDNTYSNTPLLLPIVIMNRVRTMLL